VFAQMDGNELSRADNYPDPVVSGPFSIQRWNPRTGWTLAARPDYWGGRPAVDRIEVRVYGADAELARALRDGDVDYARFDAGGPWVSQLGDGIITHTSPLSAYLGLWFNLASDGRSGGSAAARDPILRRAVAASLDRTALSDAVFSGYAVPDTSVTPPLAPIWRSDLPVSPAPSVEEASRALQDAGYRDTDGDGIRESPGGGAAVVLRCPVDVSDPVQVKTAPLIKASLAEVGIGLRAQYLTSDAYFNTVSRQGAGFDVSLTQDYASGDADPGARLHEFASSSCTDGSISTCFSDARYDALDVQQSVEQDPVARRRLVLQMEQILARELPVIVLVDPDNVEAWRADSWEGLVADDAPSRGPVLIGEDFTAGNPIAALSLRAAGNHSPGLHWLVSILAVIGGGLVALGIRTRSRRPRPARVRDVGGDP
jgi:peptide/nickel transport system substrate-binding protein